MGHGTRGSMRIDGNSFRQAIDVAFTPVLAELGFRMTQLSTTGLFYQATFLGREHRIEIWYELGELSVVIHTPADNSLPLSHLTARLMPRVNLERRRELSQRFRQLPNAVVDRNFAKIARDLALVLPLYLAHA
jgi:hypothetical protein